MGVSPVAVVRLLCGVALLVGPASALVAPGGAEPLPALGQPPGAAVSAPTLLRSPDGQDREITALAFSPDGALLAAGGWDQEILLWDVGTGRSVRTLRRLRPGDDGAVSSIVFTRTGAAIAAGRTSGTVILWEAVTGRELVTVHGPPVMGMAFSPDGRTLVAGHADGTATFWNASRGRVVHTLRAQESPVEALAFASRGGVLATAGQDGGVHLWDAASGRRLRSFAPGYPVRSVAFSPDGTVLAAGSEGAATLWETSTGEELRRLEDRSTAGVLAFSPDGAVLTAAGGDGTVRSWAVATGRSLGAAHAPTVATTLVAFAPRRGILATADTHHWGAFGDLVGSTVRLWHVASDRPLVRRRSADRGGPGATPRNTASPPPAEGPG